MNMVVLIAMLASILAMTAAFVWVAITLKGGKKGPQIDLAQQAIRDVDHLFDDKFREELKNRGRIHFEKIIGENAMFLQQDLRLTTSQLNEYMKEEITRKLKEEFAKYEESITDAKQLALDSINKTQEAIEQQRVVMSQQLAQEMKEEKDRLLKRFEANMADVVNHYIMAAIGNQIDLNDQLEFILGEMEANKEAIIKDIASES